MIKSGLTDLQLCPHRQEQLLPRNSQSHDTPQQSYPTTLQPERDGEQGSSQGCVGSNTEHFLEVE